MLPPYWISAISSARMVIWPARVVMIAPSMVRPSLVRRVPWRAKSGVQRRRRNRVARKEREIIGVSSVERHNNRKEGVVWWQGRSGRRLQMTKSETRNPKECRSSNDEIFVPRDGGGSIYNVCGV